MRLFHLHREQRLERPVEDVFAFFSSPWNLGRITPPWLRFRVVGCSDDSIREGTRIDYRLRLRGIPMRWSSVISAWNPPHDFTDEQLVGPYRRWVHRHTFRPDGSGVLAVDDVEYAVPGGALIERFLVRPDLERIFDYRHEQLPVCLERSPAAGSPASA